MAGAVDIARSAGAKIVIVNAQPTPYDDVAHAVLPGSISEVLPAILGSAASGSTAARAGLQPTA